MGIVPPGFCLLPFPFTLIHSENNQKGVIGSPPDKVSKGDSSIRRGSP